MIHQKMLHKDKIHQESRDSRQSSGNQEPRGNQEPKVHWQSRGNQEPGGNQTPRGTQEQRVVLFVLQQKARIIVSFLSGVRPKDSPGDGVMEIFDVAVFVCVMHVMVINFK
ncbi:uncharacterized protein LOC115387904 isoform X4 [Salarias fasciatus]|uniref:uncharacterized protein LOC115387904 isoform X4 n=1 Tax=Salarias fasciatus TaxID=181472 RepID=UPI001176BAB0|nr:uncharacterized protein LOC115387904 isoform X4 [Salarias fasciatus]